jgi:hypothetical protein
MLRGAEKALAVVLPRGQRIEVGIGFDASTLARSTFTMPSFTAIYFCSREAVFA